MVLENELTQKDLGANYMIGTTIMLGLQDVIEREFSHLHNIVDSWQKKSLEHLYLVGCGGSRAVLEPAKWLTDKFSDLPVDHYSGWEFYYRAPRNLNEHSATVLGSHSGETEEILKSMELAKARGSSTLSFSKPETFLTVNADESLVYKTPATNLSKLLMNYMVAVEMIERFGDKGAGNELRQALKTLPGIMQKAKDETEALGKSLAIKYKDADGFYLIATGPLAGLTYQFATCNLLEMQWKHAGVWNAAEFKHGPLEIVEEGLPMIFLLGTDETRPVAERARDFAVRHGADVISFDLADLEDFHPWLAPFGLHLPLQWMISYMGAARQHPISTRRYMGIVEY